MLCMMLSCTTVVQAAEGHIHAVIVSGGMNRLMNHERYWNDCAFLYRTLRQDYHMAKEDIIVLMSDGGDPANDQMTASNNGLASSNPDLDGDGIRDVFLAATMQNLVSVMSALSLQLTKDDHLFLFLIDHGDSDDKQGESYLWLWNNEKLNDTVLALLLEQFDVGSMNIVAGQCYSGGFIDNLSEQGRVIATACKENELSWMCPDKNYDEFIYHWTCAIAGHDEKGGMIDADANGDGRVSMAEAFHYARIRDRRDETPQYCSLPFDLGDRWTFSGVLPTGVMDVERETTNNNRSVYDLQGRPQSEHGRGACIVKGRIINSKR